MTMTVEQIESEALKLPEQARADLLGRLMHSLTDAAEAWAQEAVRRDDEMESDSVAGVSATEVFEALSRRGK